MIKTIISNSPYLVIYNHGATNYMNNYSGAQGLGNMQFNTTTQRIEVWDGQMWQPMQMNDVIPVMNSTDLAGNTYLKTAAPSVAPYGTFPARKFEYSNGRITWRRPQLPWSWETGKSVGGASSSKDIKLLLILLIAVILFYFFGRMKMK